MFKNIVCIRISFWTELMSSKIVQKEFRQSWIHAFVFSQRI